MPSTFVYFYLMAGEPARIATAVSAHVSYWQQARLQNYRGGPFADRSGGLITFNADDLRQANAVVERDPFVLQGVVGERWVKEWLRE